MQRPSLRTLFRIFSKVLLGLLLLVFVAACGTLLWLRTDKGLSTVLALAADALEGQGLSLSYTAASGPLPSQLSLRGVVLKDKKGAFFTAEEATVKLSLGSLVRRTVTVDDIQLATPVLSRLPALPPSTTEPAADDSASSFSLPVNIVVHNLEVTDGRLAEAILHSTPNAENLQAPQLQERANVVPTETGSFTATTTSNKTSQPGMASDSVVPQKKSFADTQAVAKEFLAEAKGYASLHGTNLRFFLEGMLANKEGEGISFIAGLDEAATLRQHMQTYTPKGRLQSIALPFSLDPVTYQDIPESNTVWLLVDMAANIAPHGVLSRITDSANSPSGFLSLQGSGAFTHWKGTLLSRFTVPDTFQETQAIGNISILSEQPENFIFFSSSPQFSASLDMHLTPYGTAEPLPFGLGKDVTITTGVSGTLEKLKATADVRTETASIEILSATLTTGADVAVNFDYAVTIPSITALSEAFSQPAALQREGANKDIPLATQGSFALKQEKEMLNLSVKGTATTIQNEKESSVVYSSELGIAESIVHLEAFSLTGFGLEAKGNATFETNTGNIDATFSATGKENAEWQVLVAGLLAPEEASSAILTPEHNPLFGGSFSLDIDILSGNIMPATREANVPLSTTEAPNKETSVMLPVIREGNISLTTNNMRWPAALGMYLGASPALSLQVSGGGDKAYTITIAQAKTTVATASGKATLGPIGDTIPLTSSLHVSLSDLGILTPNILGTATVAISAQGTLPSFAGPSSPLPNLRPGTSLAFDLSASSSSITIPTGQLLGIQLENKGNLSFSTPSEISHLAGSTRLSVQDGPGGPLQLDTNWQANFSKQDIRANVENLSAKMAGVAFVGNVAVVVPNNAEPQASGLVTLAISDWKKLSELSGMELSGDPATVTLHLNASNGQSATMDLSTGRIAMGENIFISSLSGNIGARNIFGALSPSANLKIGKGSAGPLDWSAGKVLFTNNGDVNIALTGPAQKGKNQAKNAVKTPSFAATDRLFLKGYLDIANSALQLHSLGLYLPKAQAGIALRDTATVSFGEGIAVKNMHLDFLPKGSFALDALFSSPKTELTAVLDSLSLDMLHAFTDAPLPGGELSLEANLLRTGANGSGIATGNVRINGGMMNMQSDAFATVAASNQPILGIDILANAGAKADTSFPGVHSSTGITRLGGSGTFGEKGKDALGTLRFDLPLVFSESGIPTVPTNVAFGAAFEWNGALSPLWQAVPLPDRHFTGNGLISANVHGTLSALKGEVTAYISEGVFEDSVNGVLLKNITMEAGSAAGGEEGLTVKALLSATDSQNGSVALEALLGPKHILATSETVKNLQLRQKQRQQKAPTSTALTKTKLYKKKSSTAKKETPRDNAVKLYAKETSVRETPVYSSVTSITDPRIPANAVCIAVRGQIAHLEPLHRDDVSMRLSGLFGVEGTVSAPFISADIMVERGNVELEILSPTGTVTTLPISNENSSLNTKRQSGPRADIHISLPGRLFIRGYGLDSEWQGKVNIDGPFSSLSLAGELFPVQGRFELLSRPFTISRGSIFFLGGGGGSINPGLDLELRHTRNSIEAIVQITGTAQHPILTMSSIPALPQDEVMSQVLFGKSATSLSRFEALQLASALRQFTGAGNNGIFSLTSIRQTLGIDVLRVGSDNGSQNNRHLSSSPGANVPGMQQNSSTAEDVSSTTIEAGKYVMDNVYVGVQQDVRGGTGVRVEVELTPSIGVTGVSTQESSQIGIGWRMDY